MQNEQPLNHDNLDPFADRLANIALDAAPPNPGRLMYECGYAAGLTAGRGRTVSRHWQMVAAVAVLVVGGLAGRWTAPSAPQLTPPPIAALPPTESDVGDEEVVQADHPPMGQSQPGHFSMVEKSRVFYAAMSPDQLRRFDQLPQESVTDAVEFAPARPLMVGGGYRLLQ